MKETFLNALSKPQPIPGGGAAAAYGASVGLALLEKIVRLELGRPRNSPERLSFWKDLLETVCRLSETLLLLREKDGETYLELVRARASAEHPATVKAALQEAVQGPLQIMEAVREGLFCAREARKHCMKHLLSDLLVVVELLYAAGRGVYHIAGANLKSGLDVAVFDKYLSDLDGILESSHRVFRETFSDVTTT